MSEREKFISDIKVGIVTFLALLLVVIGVTLAGGDKGLFLQKTVVFKARINDISGLKKGGTVTMGGMAIGKVTRVDLLENEEKNPVEVTMEIRSDIQHRIKEDSTPSIRTQGMLGDRYVEISIGSKDAPSLKPGKPLIGNNPSNFDETLEQAKNTLAETSKLLEAINHKQGTMGQFIYDEKFYQKLTDITTSMDDLLKDFKKNPRRYVKLSIF